MDIFKRIIDEYADMGGNDLDFNTTIGDPFHDSNLLTRAHYVKQYQNVATLGFVTNLQWFHRYDVNEYFDAGFTWISVSTALSGKKTYHEFFGVDRYEQMLCNLMSLIEENKKRGNIIAIHISLKPTNESTKAILSHPDFKMINSLLDNRLRESVNSMGRYVDDWLGAVKLSAHLKKRPLYIRTFRPCALLYAGLIIFSNGNIGACPCRDFEANSELILGNAETISLNDAWNGKLINEIRLNWRLKNIVPLICKRCSHYLY